MVDGTYNLNVPMQNQAKETLIFCVTKEEIDKIYDDYKNHLPESEYEKLKDMNGTK
jgi:hypothetical protein